MEGWGWGKSNEAAAWGGGVRVTRRKASNEFKRYCNNFGNSAVKAAVSCQFLFSLFMPACRSPSRGPRGTDGHLTVVV